MLYEGHGELFLPLNESSRMDRKAITNHSTRLFQSPEGEKGVILPLEKHPGYLNDSK